MNGRVHTAEAEVSPSLESNFRRMNFRTASQHMAKTARISSRVRACAEVSPTGLALLNHSGISAKHTSQSVQHTIETQKQKKLYMAR